jgi:DNA-binding CsgD family transcriptional regulator
MGVILIDTSLKAIALDRGAAAILNTIDQAGLGTSAEVYVPEEILDAVRRCGPADSLGVKKRFRIGSYDYSCRAYLVEACDAVLPQTVFVVHLKRELSDWDQLTQISSHFRLTDREQETLRGIAQGMTSKELATQMCISPNTVKAFLRLIMVKMAVSSRAGILAKLREFDRSR